MLRWFRKRRQRRRLAPVVGAVPRLLQASFGPTPAYSAAQVTVIATRLRLAETERRYALAACCSAAEFVAARPGLDVGLYDRLRGEIAKAFDIDRPKFTCEHLLALRNVPASNRWARIEDEARGGYGGGVPYDPSQL